MQLSRRTTLIFRLCDSMDREEELRTKIEELEKDKAMLIERIRGLNRRVRYKKYEKKALEPFLEQTKDVKIAPYRRKKRGLEFRISTQAYTPRLEKEWLKQLKKVEKKLDELKEIERARRKRRYVEKDIEEGEKAIGDIEKELHGLRTELRKLYEELRTVRAEKRRSAPAERKEEMIALEDLAFIENNK